MMFAGKAAQHTIKVPSCISCPRCIYQEGALPLGCRHLQAMANVEGLVVIDVVEGTALSSLPHMATVLRQRPASFDSKEAAVHWARRSGESAAETQLSRNSPHATLYDKPFVLHEQCVVFKPNCLPVLKCWWLRVSKPPVYALLL